MKIFNLTIIRFVKKTPLVLSSYYIVCVCFFLRGKEEGEKDEFKEE